MDTIINLTPPIDGVQYGISDEPIKDGDFYYLQSVTTKNMILKASESKISNNCKKIHFSNNPKDTRFPYLQLPSKTVINTELFKLLEKTEEDIHKNFGFKLITQLAFKPLYAFCRIEMPSKEQEVERLAKEEARKIYGENEIGNKIVYFYAGACFANKHNPAKYTQEQMIEFAEYQQEYQHHTANNNFQTWLLKQSIQPTAKAVRVEMVDNGYEIDMGGVGGMQLGETNWLSKMEIKVKQSTEYPQGIVRAIEVIN